MIKVCVGGVLLRENTILLGKRSAERSFYPNVWDVFGGHLEPHESPEQALARELEEELGIIPLHAIPLEVIQVPATEQHGAYEFHLYLVTEWSGNPSNRLPREHSEIQWFSLKQAQQLDLAHPGYSVLFQQLAQDSKLQ